MSAYAYPDDVALIARDCETYVGTCSASPADSDDPAGESVELAIAYDGRAVEAYLNGEPVQLDDAARGELVRLCEREAARYDASEEDEERRERGYLRATGAR